jgi:hypothetical protein
MKPLRRVVRLVKKTYTFTHKNGRQGFGSHDRELLECGHLFAAPWGLYGTTIGDTDSRRCPHCEDNQPADDITGWEEL